MRAPFDTGAKLVHFAITFCFTCVQVPTPSSGLIKIPAPKIKEKGRLTFVFGNGNTSSVTVSQRHPVTVT